MLPQKVRVLWQIQELSGGGVCIAGKRAASICTPLPYQTRDRSIGFLWRLPYNVASVTNAVLS